MNIEMAIDTLQEIQQDYIDEKQYYTALSVAIEKLEESLDELPTIYTDALSENTKLKYLLRWQKSRMEKYQEFIRGIGGIIEAKTTKDYWDIHNLDGELQTQYTTIEKIEIPTLLIGHKGIQDKFLKDIENLLKEDA